MEVVSLHGGEIEMPEDLPNLEAGIDRRNDYSAVGFVGARIDVIDCYEGESRHTVVAANEGPFTIVLDFFSNSAEGEAIFATALGSLEWTGISTPTG